MTIKQRLRDARESTIAQDQREMQLAAISQLRAAFVAKMTDDPQAKATPIRMMARMTSAVTAECRARGYDETLIATEVVNRTIGDINLRYVVEHDERYEYRTLADELGIALPGEDINGITATGARYYYLRERMMVHERALLARGYDAHMYDLPGVGNPILREWLCADQEQWGLRFTPEQVLLSNGSLDGLDKAMRGLRASRWAGPAESSAIIFPSPGFNVPEWQARSLGISVVQVRTTPESGYRLTAAQLRETLTAHPEARGLYLTLSNNPTAFSYTPTELLALLDIVAEHPQLMVLADMAYTGTGELADERARLATFAGHPAFSQAIFFWTLSKVYTMTGDRFGYLCVGDPTLAPLLGISWANVIASLPAEWQFRYMAFYEFVRDHPEIREKISGLYRLRRRALVAQLREIDHEQSLFARVNLDDGGTVYNWSQLRAGEDVFSLFKKTGIAGVPGSAFGFSDDHIRFSIGIVPVVGWESLVQTDAAKATVQKQRKART